MDNFLNIKKSLENEIYLYESFVPDTPCFDDLGTTLDFLSFGVRLILPEQYDEIYDLLFRTYPIIKTRISKAVFPSWLITHSVEELKQIIGFKYE